MNSGDHMQRTPAIHEEPFVSRNITAVLQQTARYHLSVFASCEQLPEFADCGPREVRQCLREAERRQLVGSAPLHANLRYWYLLPAGAALLQLDTKRNGPLSESAKLRAYAMLRFCCLSDKPRHRLTASELQKHFPVLSRPGLPSTYYFEPGGRGRLGLARIDVGHRGRWDRVLQSVRADMNEHAAQSGFRQLIQADRFEMTVLTVFRQKAVRLREAFFQRGDTAPTTVNVYALPDLLPLLTSS